jgi:putative transport protein
MSGTLAITAAAAAGTAGRSIAANLAILSLAVTIGLAIGAIQVRRLKLGISGVLFSSLLFGQLGFSIEHNVLEFLRDFALIVFMYAIGLQVGPGFGASLRAEGVRLNVLAFVVIVLGAVMTAVLVKALPTATTPGLYAGAFTTTPGLAAAQETMSGTPAGSNGETAAARTGLAYSITYPFGVVGPMLVVVLLRYVFRVRLDDERTALAKADEKSRLRIDVMDVEVTSRDQAGKRVQDHPLLRGNQIILSRVLRDDVLAVPTPDTVLQVGDVYRAVGPSEQLTKLITALGRSTSLDGKHAAHGDVSKVELVATRTSVLHRPLRELDLLHRTGVKIARVHRNGVELSANGALRLAFGDQITAVGPKAGLKTVEAELGNSQERLNQSQLIPIFLGIVLGVLVGSIPLAIPGLHGSLRVGLAGGSLLAAVALSRLGSVGSIVWYMPAAANQLFRDFGLAVFLACVGFQAGDHFVERAAQTAGLALVLWGAAVTMLPVFVVACFARLVLRMNFITLLGWVAGAMGSSPTLLFVQEMTSSNTPAVPYAAVLPLAELLPIICTQVLAILCIGR